MVTIPRKTPVSTTHIWRDSATAATTLSRLKARSASSTLRTTTQNERAAATSTSLRSASSAFSASAPKWVIAR